MQGVSQKEFYQEPYMDVVDDFGFLINREQWSESFAEYVLGLNSGELTESHLKAIRYVRNRYLHLRELPPLKRIFNSGSLEKSEMEILFESCVELLRAAGFPRPDEEVESAMNS